MSAAKKTSSRVKEPAPFYVGSPALWRAADSPLRDTPLLLDTHAWLWTLDGTAGALTKPAIRIIDRAAAEGRLFVSDISFWEVAMLVSKGRLELAADPTIWLRRAAFAPGIQLLPLARDVLIESTRLAGTPYGDPADRMLIAQAQLIGASLLTCDKGIVAYAARTPGVPVCDAR
jgi:PIN domain nuclease of toxin-antitoxin system